MSIHPQQPPTRQNKESMAETERHPLAPFLPQSAKLLMLGSFPPPHHRWCMEFFYPNPQNDMWRIFGHIFFDNKSYFYDEHAKSFRKEQIETFLTEKGIAVFDTATVVRRLHGNASDEFLEIVQPTDVAALLRQIPLCHTIITTGGRATEEICRNFNLKKPGLGGHIEIPQLNAMLYRMPSSSSSYPLKIERKADYYRSVFDALDML